MFAESLRRDHRHAEALQAGTACGLIPGMNATIGAIGSPITTMQQQVAETGTLITATAHNLDTVGPPSSR